MPTRLLPPGYQEFDANGVIAAGAKLYTYGVGTSTPKATYSDSALTVANANPVVADGSGRFGDIFAGVGSYRLVMTKSDGSTLWTADPVDGATSGGTGGISTGNVIVNGDFRVEQDGFTFNTYANDAQYLADSWLALAQTARVNIERIVAPEDGQAACARVSQPNITAQRFGIIQWVPSLNSTGLRASAVTLSGRIRISTSQALRYAILEWVGTADQPTLDPVNDWTSSSYTTGSFFVASNFTITAVGSLVPAGNVWTDLPSLTGTISSAAQNIAVMFWTEGTAVQNVYVDFGLLRLNAGSTDQGFERRPYGLERFLTTPDPELTDRTNLVTNGGYEVWQRGTSIAIAASTTATASVYTADRWCMETSANQAMTVARQTGMTDQSQYRVQVQRNAGQTGTTALRFQHPFELPEIVMMRGQYLSVSFLANAGANFSGSLRVKFLVGTGAAGRRTNAAAYTGEATIMDALLFSAANDYAKFTASSTVVVPTTTTQATLVFEWTPSGTAGASDAFSLDNVQLSLGLSPMNYVHEHPEITLAKCQRFFQVTEAGILISGYAEVGGRIYNNLYVLPVRMRATPTVSSTFSGSVNCTPSIANVSSAHFQIQISATGAGGATSTYSSGNTIEASL